MLDFVSVATRTRNKVTEVYPKFIIKKSSDLMIRGRDFYAIWVEERGLWSTDEQDAIQLIDREIKRYVDEHSSELGDKYRVLYLWDAESKMIDVWHKYCEQQLRDNFHMLDEKLIFSNTPTNKKDYASKRLSYPLEEAPCPAYDEIMSTLYSEEERHKIEWAIGSIVTGDSVKLQKFIVLYGAAGTGKSTILNIIQQLFEGYYSVFDAKALGSSNNTFALEAFKSNPLVAIQHDGDLSRIEDNTRLNSLVSHEMMTINEKFKSTYANRFKCFLFMGTNKPVKITDGKSGLIRRLIDVSPSGNKLSAKEYKRTTKQVSFELGAIASHCKKVYLDDPGRYDNYMPLAMLGASNDFYNFVIDSYHIFKREDGTTLKAAWEMYKTYCDEAKVSYPFSQRNFKEELKNYFWEYNDKFDAEDGSRIRSYYSGFRTDKFEEEKKEKQETDKKYKLIQFTSGESIFDKEYADCPAQYANSKGTPSKKWDEVTTKLSDLDTSKLHYVLLPDDHIFIDFDIKDEKGNKSYERNLKEASKWPPTYGELSKSGAGIHLHYIYSGDPSTLSNIYDKDIEVKTCYGKRALRRQLTKCNNLPIATISSGLPLKGEKMINSEVVRTEKGLRTTINKCIRKEVHPGTKPNVDYIYKLLEEYYESGDHYDVTDMRNKVFAFAAGSTNHADYCIKLVNKMHFKSEEPAIAASNDEAPLVFYDVEVFSNLFVVCWKAAGEGKPVVKMINPTSADIEELLRYRLVGFNNRRYDDHILYARLMGYDNEQLFNLSQKIISGNNNAFFGEAYNLSYTDIYDFSSKKQSLKKFEIDLGIHHQELGLPWDKPVPEDMWEKVAEYCTNDVVATEAVFNARKADFTARCILADVAGMPVSSTTNALTTRIIFGNNHNPQSQFNYRNMGRLSDIDKYIDDYTVFDKEGRPIFPGYKFRNGKSSYRGEKVGEGGYVYAEPGMYGNIALLDIASMHPSSIVAERLFGNYTDRFSDILNARIAIKHKDFDHARKMLGGALAKYLDDEAAAADLAQALKIAINSVYGLTAANFENPFRDNRNKDNIVAKRGALFMINLKHEVQQKGFVVAHIKTDSIKIADATPEIIQFVVDYGKMYGYNFEHEATYDRMCLVNNAVYIAKYATVEHCYDLYGKEYVEQSKDILKDNKKDPGKWTATGTQFQVPYVFKTLFSKEPIEFSDMCETKSVAKGEIYLDRNEELGTGEHNYIFVGRIGQFCPIKSGCCGGVLYRKADGKYYAVTGTKDYRWLESEMVKLLDKEDDIDRSYYDKLVDAAITDISKHGDFNWFVSDEPYTSPEYDERGRPIYYPTDSDEVPWRT